MKAVLAGTAVDHYLALRVLLAKVLGAIPAAVAGLSVGKEVGHASIVRTSMSSSTLAALLF
jgi:hypothetical protein